MSGDVQPRKRKDKKRKKDELGVEEHRGTAAVFGEGDVLMHSHHEHGTGGHWCAKIIFFSLLAVLVTLIGLIILENRGLSELEANAVESRYSGVLDGWIEDAPEDDHHDEHTLELKHHEEDDHEDEYEESEEAEEEIEKIEKEVTEQEEPESVELPLPEASFEREDEASVEMLSPDEVDQVDVSEYLEADDLDEPAVERIAPPPPGKPYVEIEEPVSTEAPPNTLAEEEEYEKQQEQLRQEEEQSTHMWLKLAVGGALLAATHAVIRRAAAVRDAPDSEVEEHDNREETPVTDRRMTLVQEEAPKLVPVQSVPPKVEEEVIRKSAPVEKAVPKQESEEVEEDEETEEGQETEVTNKNKELYSDEDENEEDEEVEEEEEVEEKVVAPKSVQKVAEAKKEEESEHEDVPEDVEIIDEDEEVEEEVEDDEEISDVDDAELLSRLEAKYGRLPEPDRPGLRHKDGGNSVEDDWPGEPSDAFWREQLDKAEQELRQDWLD